MSSLPESPICLYGAGQLGQLALDFCSKNSVEVSVVVDKQPVNDVLVSVSTRSTAPVVTIDQYLKKYADIPLYIAIATEPYNAIKRSLNAQGINNIYPFYMLTSQKSLYPLNNGWVIDVNSPEVTENVIRIHELLEDEHSRSNFSSFFGWHTSFTEEYEFAFTPEPEMRYAVPELINFLSNRSKVLIDVGAHHGQCKTKLFNKGISFDQVHFFEPDPETFSSLRLIQGDHLSHFFYQQALSNEFSPARFASGYNYCSRLCSVGDLQLTTKPLDSYNLQCDLLKIHTEGSELDILKGSKTTIFKHRPAVVLSVYHSSDIIFKTIHYISSTFKNYKIYFRSHNYQGTGSFLYCIPSH